ncbi:MAG: LysM peptidoglycan-binding domain-containing protein [Myxococcales bacterium]|nr:LysM peptidoglycan-binding domain-containing protein [Myxococcales bacterium]MCB9735773.1 LysM peptidoglycan-binding domain-containing protein [Deltaproteobacteria bacterium]
MTAGLQLIRSLAEKAMAAADTSGSLAKAELVVFTNPELEEHLDTIPFFLNPSTISVERRAKFEDDAHNQARDDVKYKGTDPISLQIGELWFDTYDERRNVREVFIDRLEELVDYYDETHVPRVVSFVWGGFSHGTKHARDYVFYVESVKVDYLMFLSDGTPVRAKVALCLKQVTTTKREDGQNQKRSPDHAKRVVVRRGDTLQGIAAREYKDPREWRRIAATNGIENPMSLRVGSELLVPPILR